MAELRPGLRLRSQACETEVLVVAAPAGDVDLRCGGHPMIEMTGRSTEPRTSSEVVLDPDYSEGSQLGKRYTRAGLDSLELLVTNGGEGTLAEGSDPLTPKEAKALPSSD